MNQIASLKYVKPSGNSVKVLARQKLERVTGIEPAWPAWKAGALPLSYTRVRRFVAFNAVNDTNTSVSKTGRDAGIRTLDLLLPKQAR
jgi:hypothetical protein